MKIVVNGVLPYKMSDCTSNAVRLAEQRLLFRHVLPFAEITLSVTMVRRVRKDAYLQNVYDIILVLSLIVRKNNLLQLLVSDVLANIRKTSTHIELNNPSVFRESFANLVDIAYYCVLARIRAHTYTVIKRVVGHPCLQVWA